MQRSADVLIIGAGPAGAVAAALLVQKGYSVIVLERSRFPRFSIGESLLPQSVNFLKQAGMLDAVRKAGFQYKDGAAFIWKDKYETFVFADKSSEGPDSTYQVERAKFDDLLAKEAARMGADVRFEHEIRSVDVSDPDQPRLDVLEPDGTQVTYTARFLLDASGFGRVLARQLDLAVPSDFPSRVALFTHVQDNAAVDAFDRNKIQIVTHPEKRNIWYWLIPFPDGRCSLGVVASQEALDVENNKHRLDALLWDWVAEEPFLGSLLENAESLFPARFIGGYTSKVKHMQAPGYALLGNAGEFLDPVFSSGVTIAMHSAVLASDVLDRHLQGENVDWHAEFEVPMKNGIKTFTAYVRAWYDHSFQDIVYNSVHQPDIKRMICSVLAGFAWDQDNPFAKDASRRLGQLHALIST
ncbi:MAG TPA: NAD(P)/FAD-dependent oxidoreductase [Gammaproteobacteria bacterium]|nr:NAD(P)/FAD-dependent oxidoreductase [Gammaproteobacteria bacterium]